MTHTITVRPYTEVPDTEVPVTLTRILRSRCDIDVGHELQIKQISLRLGLNGLYLRIWHALNGPYVGGSRATWESCGLEDEVLLDESVRLHGGYPRENGQNLLVPRRRHLAKEEELVHLNRCNPSWNDWTFSCNREKKK